jgi:peptidoglycan/xylan/chitin deacetylase (PgdA/CDA1 family)
MSSLVTKARQAGSFGWREAKALLGMDAGAPVILMYHSISSPLCDPWGLCVSGERFREQLAALKRTRTLLSVDQLVNALDAGVLPPAAAAITFDDGYADNAEVAKPMLEAMQIPATFFLTTDFVGRETPFWWDELAALVLAGRSVADIDLEVAGVRLTARWDAQAALPPDLAAWRYFMASAEARRTGYLRLWRALRTLAPGDRDLAMTELRARLSPGEDAADLPVAMPMSRNAARKMASALIGVGGHGKSHVPLPALPASQRQREIVEGRADLTALTGVDEPSGFAYPHGECDAETRDMVAGAVYRWAVTTDRAAIDPRRYDRFALPRLQVGNWSGRALLRAMRHGRAL